MKTKYKSCWDEITLEVTGNEFELDTVLNAQIVSDFLSPVYSFVVNSGVEIHEPESVSTMEFKAPWED